MNVLLVEDNYEQALLFKLYLQRVSKSHFLTHCSDGESALTFLDQTQHQKLDVIFLDLRLPKIDGLEVLSLISRNDHLKNIPVIIMTSSTLESDREAVDKFHPYKYLVKPVKLPLLFDIFNELSLKEAL